MLRRVFHTMRNEGTTEIAHPQTAPGEKVETAKNGTPWLSWIATALLKKRWLVIVALLVLSTAVAPAATAGSVRRIRDATGPHRGNRKMIAGGGSWITNKPGGYYLGRAPAGSEFNVMGSRSDRYGRDWPYGRAVAINMCGWVLPDALGSRVATGTDSCSARTRDDLSHRRSFGKNFNARPHRKNTGTDAPVGSCRFYYNYFQGSDFSKSGGHWAWSPGSTAGGTVKYRFTTLDGKAAVVLHPVMGWGFIARGCVNTSEIQLNNIND